MTAIHPIVRGPIDLVRQCITELADAYETSERLWTEKRAQAGDTETLVTAIMLQAEARGARRALEAVSATITAAIAAVEERSA